MTGNALELEAVGWCHGCGTVQLKSDMPLDYIEWKEATAPVCVECGAEPWSIGVWNKGEHASSCSWVNAAKRRTVDWTPDFPCNCPQ